MSAVYSPHVRFLRKWGIRGGGDGEFRWPLCLIIDGAGNVYVSECSNDRIQVFDPQGRFLRKWGARAAATGSSSIQRESRWHQTVASTLQIQSTTASRSSQWGSAAAASDEDDVKVCSLNLRLMGCHVNICSFSRITQSKLRPKPTTICDNP